MDSVDAERVQVPAATPVIVPAEYVQAPAGLAVTPNVTVPPDGASALTPIVAPIVKSENEDGVNVGSFAKSDDVAEIVALGEAVDLKLSPTIFVATTLTV